MNFGLVKTFDHLPRVKVLLRFRHVRFQKDMSKMSEPGIPSRCATVPADSA